MTTVPGPDGKTFVANPRECDRPGAVRIEGNLPKDVPQAVHAADDVVLTEQLTFYGMKSLATLLSLRLHGVALDRDGLSPEALDLACRQTGAIEPGVMDHLKDEEEVFSARASAILKSTQVIRFLDRKRVALVYLTYSDRIVDGSPDNSISVVPIRALAP